MEKVFRKSSLNSDLFTPSKTSECDQQKSQTSQSDHTLNISYLEEAASSWSKVPKSNRTTTDKDEVIELMKHERQRSPQPLPTKSNYTKHNETFWSITIQVFIPFLIAGMGMVAAGLVLGIVQHWPIFEVAPEIFILVPALLGLKGNLEMTLASRLSTQANLGKLDTLADIWELGVGNLSLIQVQAIVVGFLASIIAFTLGWMQDKHFELNHFLVLCSSGVLTASIASFALGLLTMIVIVLSRRLNINPDNVATPIAASLGDLTTLSLLACISDFLFTRIEYNKWICPTILAITILSMPLLVLLARTNSLTRKVLRTGWIPVLSAMVISSSGGLIFDIAIIHFSGIAVFQPVVNGVGGNLVAVQASRISTAFHQETGLGILPHGTERICRSPLGTFSSGEHSRTARALLLMVIPGQLIFVLAITFLRDGQGHTISFTFVMLYLMAALIQVFLLLYIAEVLINFLWLRKIDPDNSAIPYLTALGDIIGTALLAAVFLLLFVIEG